MAMELIDNVHKRLRDDLKEVIHKDSMISVAAASFSIYAFQELKTELEKCKEFRFIFTAPTFTTELCEYDSEDKWEIDARKHKSKLYPIIDVTDVPLI